MLSGVMLSGVMLIGVMLNVVVPPYLEKKLVNSALCKVDFRYLETEQLMPGFDADISQVLVIGVFDSKKFDKQSSKYCLTECICNSSL
jgi:hypothetical protein